MKALCYYIRNGESKKLNSHFSIVPPLEKNDQMYKRALLHAFELQLYEKKGHQYPMCSRARERNSFVESKTHSIYISLVYPTLSTIH